MKLIPNLFYFRADGIQLHVSNTPALFHGLGTDLDYIRMGISLFGQPPGNRDEMLHDGCYVALSDIMFLKSA